MNCALWLGFLKARLHRRFLSRQLDAVFVALKLHQVSNMFETPATSRRQIALKIAPGLHVRFWSCNFRATKTASSCRDKNRLCKRALNGSMAENDGSWRHNPVTTSPVTLSVSRSSMGQYGSLYLKKLCRTSAAETSISITSGWRSKTLRINRLHLLASIPNRFSEMRLALLCLFLYTRFSASRPCWA